MVDQVGLPRYWAAVWSIFHGGGLAPSTLHEKVKHIEALYQHADTIFGQLDDALSALNFDAISTVLESFFVRLRNVPRPTNSVYARWTTAFHFVRDTCERIERNPEMANRMFDIRERISRLDRLYMGLRPFRKRLGTQLRAIPRMVVLEMLDAVIPGSLANPFKQENTQWRVYSLVTLLLFQGLRRGEALSLRADFLKSERDPRTGMMRWHMCSLIKPDFGDIYQEIYGHFGSRPEDLYKLSPRNFEILLSRIFQAQGFKTELGPGSGDGGIDVKFWQRDPIGDILTLVQAKRYAPHKKIKLEAVAALRGVMAVEKAPRGMFVTTSAYLPSARKFAGRESNVVDLKTTTDVAEWCAAAEQGIIADKSTLISDDFVIRLLGRLSLGNDPRVVHATTGYNMVINLFALVLKETKHAALLMSLPAHKVSDDGYGQRGAEIPSFGIEAVANRKSELVWRAKRSADDRGRATYWDGKHLFFVWDGKSKPFDYVD